MTQLLTTPPSPIETSLPVLDRRQLLDRCLGSEKLAQRCLTRFAQKLPDDAESVERQAADEDWQELVQTAHRIKGSALTVAAEALAGSAAALEKCARGDGSSNVDQLVDALLCEVDRLMDAVSRPSQIA